MFRFELWGDYNEEIVFQILACLGCICNNRLFDHYRFFGMGILYNRFKESYIRQADFFVSNCGEEIEDAIDTFSEIDNAGIKSSYRSRAICDNSLSVLAIDSDRNYLETTNNEKELKKLNYNEEELLTLIQTESKEPFSKFSIFEVAEFYVREIKLEQDTLFYFSLCKYNLIKVCFDGIVLLDFISLLIMILLIPKNKTK